MLALELVGPNGLTLISQGLISLYIFHIALTLESQRPASFQISFTCLIRGISSVVTMAEAIGHCASILGILELAHQALKVMIDLRKTPEEILSPQVSQFHLLKT